MFKILKRAERKLKLQRAHLTQKPIYDRFYYSVCYTHQTYSMTTGILLSFLIFASIVSLEEGLLGSQDYYLSPEQSILVYPFFTAAIFILMFFVMPLGAHKFIFYPFVCLVIGYSYSSILKHIFPIDIEFFTFTYWIAGGLFIYAFFVREFYTFRYYLFSTIMSLPISYTLVLIIMSTLYQVGVPIKYLSYSGVWLFLVFNYCYIKAFRHRFHVISAIVALGISIICTLAIFNIWGTGYSPSTLLHNLNDAFILISIYGLIIAYLTLFREQKEPYALWVPAYRSNATFVSLPGDPNSGTTHYSGTTSPEEYAYQEGYDQARREFE
ncbi:TPA: hypothetical protein QC183_004149 [Bacillus cereus]|nr:hypothetical protein [Bacillus cereus]